jgi:hypothetical protein
MFLDRDPLEEAVTSVPVAFVSIKNIFCLPRMAASPDPSSAATGMSM